MTIVSKPAHTTIEPDPGVHDFAAISAAVAARAGVPVIPLWPGSKQPIGATGRGHLAGAERNSEAVLDRTASLFHELRSRPGWGIVTGGRLAVLDLDGPDATRWMDELCARHPDVARWCDATVRVRTARGIHYYGAVPEGVTVGNSIGMLAPHVDVRGAGGYVVAPGTRHPSGSWYGLDTDAEANATAADADPGALRDLFADIREDGADLTVATVSALSVPAPLLDLMVQHSTGGGGSRDNDRLQTAPDPARRAGARLSEDAAQRRIDGLVRTVREVPRGEGNGALNRAAGVAAALGADRSVVEPRLIEAYLARPTEERREARRREAEATVGSGWKWGLSHPEEALRDRARPGERARVEESPVPVAPKGPATHEERLAREAAAEGGDGPAIAPVFADLSALLAGDLRAAAPDAGPARSDGARLFYAGKVNALVGDPEAAKSLLALVVLADGLQRGQCAVFIDTDHNGPELVVRFLLAVGVEREAVVSRLRYAEPDDREELLAVVDAVAELEPCPVVFDSVGENLSLWGVSSNDDQGFIDMNRMTAARLARLGHTVLTIDHFAKNSESRNYGATGTTAKKRAVDGVMYEVRIVDEFSPDKGGRSALLLRKDRNGGVRALGVRTGEVAASFALSAPDGERGGRQRWSLTPGGPVLSREQIEGLRVDADVSQLEKLDPPPSSRRDVMGRMKWGTARAGAAYAAWKHAGGSERDG